MFDIFKGEDLRRKIFGGSCLVEEVSILRILNLVMWIYIIIFEGGRYFVFCFVMVRVICVDLYSDRCLCLFCCFLGCRFIFFGWLVMLLFLGCWEGVGI